MVNNFYLDNGTCIVSEYMPHSKTVSIGIWVRAGSMYETENENGISHFAEHMLFKGTQKRSAFALAEETDLLGGQMDAYTARECTCYYMKVLPENLEQAADILSDMYFNSVFTDEDTEIERGVITEEINMYEDSPEDVALDSLAEFMWQSNPLGFPISGKAETINTFTPQQIKSFTERFYTPENTVISVAGCFDEGSLYALLKKYFSSFKHSGKSCVLPVTAHSGRIETERDTEQGHLSIGYTAFDIFNNDIYTLSLLNTVLGGSVSGRLFQSLREKHGLCYSIYSYTSLFPQTGMLGIYAGLNEESLEKAEKAIGEETEKLRTSSLTSREIERVRSQMRCNIIMSNESASSRMSSNGKMQLLRGKVTTDEEILNAIEKIKPEDVLSVARKVLDEDKKAVFIINKLK